MYNLTLEASYPTPYATSPYLSLILLSMIGQKHTPDTTTEIKDAYDYIIVGAGSAGSIVAGRLSEKECVTVLLLEAGKSPPKGTDIPGTSRGYIQSDLDWDFQIAPQIHTGEGLIGRASAWPSGKAIGGSSILNAMLHVRGNKRNYDDWARQGAIGWSYKEVLPYFKKLEQNVNEEFIRNGYHGVDGPVTVSKPEYDSELKLAALKAAKQFGYRIGDSNGPIQSGFSDFQATMRKGQRCSAAKAYLVPAEYRENLDIVSEAFVEKIIIENRTARGVKFTFKGETRLVEARKEVIVSAGAVNTARLLMLSGIGPSEELEKHGIPVVANLPVDRHMQDHWGGMLPFELGDNIKPFSKKLTDELQINEYIRSKKGPLTSAQGVSAMFFLDLNSENDYQDDFPALQLYFWNGLTEVAQKHLKIKPEYYDAIYRPYEGKPFFWCLSEVAQPKGSGEVTLRSSNPFNPPIIDPRYFSHPDDLEVVVEGLKKCKKLGLSDPLKEIGSKMFTTVHPGCEDVVDDDDQYFRCMVKAIVMTFSHYTGTARMGDARDPNTVVDPKLRVKTIRHLRVVDGSVMPNVTTGNTNVPIMMIAEKASDMIKETFRCESDIEIWP